MNAREAIKIALASTRDVLGWYVSDLSDADLAHRVVPSANTIAWQLGHLISSEAFLLKDVPGAVFPELPATFNEHYTSKGSATMPPGGYLKKSEFLDWFNKVRAATLANVDRLTDADLDKPNNNMVGKFAPTIGALLLLVSNHTLMHAGQFTVTRRALNKPVLF